MARILVVEDDPDVLTLVMHKLRRAGHDVTSAMDGEAGLASVRAEHPELVILDWMMPKMTGLEVCHAVREDPAVSRTRILMLTVSENENDLAAALQAGADGYLLKTVELDHLSEFIIKVLAGESVISPEMMTKLVTAFRSKSAATEPLAQTPIEPTVLPETPAEAAGQPARAGIDLLSAREREVLALIALGDSNKVIARKLDIAETTVKIHVQHILRKLQLTSRVQAAVVAAGLDAG